MTKTLLDADRLNNVASEQVAEAGFVVIDALQRFTPEAQAAGSVAVFLLLCEALRVEPQDIFVVVKNILFADGDGRIDHFRALRLYIDNELNKK